jgi:glyoxylase-like metal-dependent hydrolase (beta-lactamase superfamily II)
MRILPLSEGSFTIGKDKLFHPFNEATDDLDSRSKGSLLVEVQPFCIVHQKDVMMLDTGLGFLADGQMQVHANLKKQGMEPEQVTKVLLTHLHKDHAGGVSYADRLGNARLAFPNATYFVQRREYEFAEKTGSPSFIVEEFHAFDTSPRVFWLNDDEGSIDGYIRYKLTAGHSPYHQVFWIEGDGQTIFFGGDEAPQHKQMLSRMVAKYDYNGKKSMELRQQWWQEGKEKNWTILYYHDVQLPMVSPGRVS